MLFGKRSTILLSLFGTSHKGGLCLGLMGTIISARVIEKRECVYIYGFIIFKILFIFFPQPEQCK